MQLHSPLGEPREKYRVQNKLSCQRRPEQTKTQAKMVCK